MKFVDLRKFIASIPRRTESLRSVWPGLRPYLGELGAVGLVAGGVVLMILIAADAAWPGAVAPYLSPPVFLTWFVVTGVLASLAPDRTRPTGLLARGGRVMLSATVAGLAGWAGSAYFAPLGAESGWLTAVAALAGGLIILI